MFTKPVDIRHRRIAKHAKGKILDIGYIDHPNLFLRGEVWGLDLIIDAKPPNYKKVVVGDAAEISRLFGKKQFDTVVAAEIIEHLENPAAFLRGVREVIKDSGKLVISTPNPYHLPTIFANMFFIKPVFTAHKSHDPYHITLFPFRNMVTLLEHCDFRLERVENGNGLILNLKVDSRPVIPFFKAFSQDLIYVVSKSP